jgi:hypothetical protein
VRPACLSLALALLAFACSPRPGEQADVEGVARGAADTAAAVSRTVAAPACPPSGPPGDDWPEVRGQDYSLRLPSPVREIEPEIPEPDLDTFERREWRGDGWGLLYEEGYLTRALDPAELAEPRICRETVGGEPAQLLLARGGSGVGEAFVVSVYWGEGTEYGRRFVGRASAAGGQQELLTALRTIRLGRTGGR